MSYLELLGVTVASCVSCMSEGELLYLTIAHSPPKKVEPFPAPPDDGKHSSLSFNVDTFLGNHFFGKILQFFYIHICLLLFRRICKKGVVSEKFCLNVLCSSIGIMGLEVN